MLLTRDPGQMVFSLPCVFILHNMADEVLIVSVCVQVQEVLVRIVPHRVLICRYLQVRVCACVIFTKMEQAPP